MLIKPLRYYQNHFEPIASIDIIISLHWQMMLSLRAVSRVLRFIDFCRLPDFAEMRESLKPMGIINTLSRVTSLPGDLGFAAHLFCGKPTSSNTSVIMRQLRLY